jgi:CheY-like chemotaxis protein
MAEESKQKKILLVDDDNFLLDMYSMKFGKEGYKVVTATSPDDAIEKLGGGYTPDILIFDLIMPKMNGIELFKKLKEDDLVNETVNVILTNQGKASDLEEVKDLGIDGYIVKALHTPSEVVEKVTEIYNNKK